MKTILIVTLFLVLGSCGTPAPRIETNTLTKTLNISDTTNLVIDL